MIFLAATGKIDPASIRLNGDHAYFVLQNGCDRYKVEAVGLEQRQVIASYLPGQTVFILGTAQNNKKILIQPRIILGLDQIRGKEQIILLAARQLMEDQLRY